MSRFIEELKRMAGATAQPIGFRVVRLASSEPRMLFVAGVSAADTGRLADYVDGADAVLLRLTKSGPAAKALQGVADIPWGGWLGDISDKKVETLVGAGCDFVVFPAASRVLTTPRDEKIGKILQVEPSLDDSLLRAVNDLPVDALLIAGAYEAGGSLAWHHLMLFQRLANLLAKPWLVPAPSSVTADEVRALWEVGVDGLVVEMGAGQPAGGLRELRRSIGKLPPRSAPKRGKTEALLPYAGGVKETESVEEEEDED
ncbi:hypothetical protein ACFLX3_00985 [Chloroflexota bacterium]